jgi:hypothetical protein
LEVKENVTAGVRDDQRQQQVKVEHPVHVIKNLFGYRKAESVNIDDT